jgi:hypothetical protein
MNKLSLSPTFANSLVELSILSPLGEKTILANLTLEKLLALKATGISIENMDSAILALEHGLSGDAYEKTLASQPYFIKQKELADIRKKAASLDF